jgi:hypothetical protein
MRSERVWSPAVVPSWVSGAVLTAGPHQNVWLNPWFDGDCAALTTGGVLLMLTFVSWWRARRRRISDPGTAVQPAGQPQQARPLQMFPKEGEWRLSAGTVWGFAIPVRAVNVTEESITLAYYRLLGGPDATQRPPLAHNVQAAVDRWMEELAARHSSELFAGEVVVEPGEPVTRWFIGSAYALPDNGGRPALTLQFEDVSGDAYQAPIPARPRQVY